MGKIGGGFWPFLAGKRAGSDSEVLATLYAASFLPKQSKTKFKILQKFAVISKNQ